MRWYQLSTCILLPFLAARASPQSIAVYLHPTPAVHSHSVPTLSPAQAKAVLAHHLGETIDVFEEIPADEGLWGHLIGMWKGENEGGKAKVVVIEGGISPQDVLPTTLPSSPSFYLPETSTTRTLLAPYLERASHVLSHMLDSIPSITKSFKDAFDLAGTKAAAALSHELSCLTVLADSIPWIDESGISHPWEAITISSLAQVDRSDEVWETGTLGVKAGLAAMTTPDSPPLLLVILPSSSSHLHTRAERHLQGRANSSLAASCYSSNSSCSDSTSCYGRGICSLKSNAGGAECWGCKCANGYAGVECQKEDYTVPFVILIFSSVLLLAMLYGSVALLYTVGETKLPSTLTLAIGGHMKRD
ncbi:MAG: hypothetical protein TREMPRED_000268 [Tremellales sp. Tagirdzhanova-0007]|nr:MAG: hypothetical protein TREMPRED_000268 [Tremellales sp. Tagirdzhanova-0007]